MKKILRAGFQFFIVYISCHGFAGLVRPVSASSVTSTASSMPAQQLQSPLPEIPPAPRSKLEIIQYILLPFAIGASIWLILCLERMEREEGKQGGTLLRR